MKLLKFTKRLHLDKDIKQITVYFFIWRITLFFISALAPAFIPLRSKDFLGGEIESYIKAPWFFSWANFDGEHYLSIATIGYKGLEQAFFPVYPLLIKIFSYPFGNSKEILITVGLLISNISFFLALIILWKLILMDYSKEVARLALITILIFPTSFYFGSLYNESLFLLMSVASFYLIRQKRWFLAFAVGALSCATRIFGILLTPVFLVEIWQKRIKFSRSFWIVFIPIGLLGYMYYQWVNFNDFLAFYHLQKIVGPQHQSGITFIPQIYYRYIKILSTTPVSNPIFQTVFLEFFIGIVFFILPIYGYFKKIRFSYLLFAFFGFLLPTIQGSFSSLPRYVIVFFPSFLCLAIFLNTQGKPFKLIVLILLALWLVIESSLFFRGYWVA